MFHRVAAQERRRRSNGLFSGSLFVAGLLLLAHRGIGQEPGHDKKAGAAAPQTAPTAAEAEVTNGLEHAYQSYFELMQTAWEPGQDITGQAVVSPVDIMKRETWKGNWEKMGAVLQSNGNRPYTVLVRVVNAKTRKVASEQRLPVDPKPLAEATRKLPPDAKHIANNIDVPAVLSFRIPAGTLKEGVYRLLLLFAAPDGTEHAFPSNSTIENADYLLIRSLEKSRITLPGQAEDAPALLTQAAEIASPGKRQYPGDDAPDCQARSVWTLQTFQNRVYVGYGDWDRNRGPIQVWSFGTPQAQGMPRRDLPERYWFEAGTSPRLTFLQEFLTNEESIDRYRVCGDTLLIPGIDGNKENGPDGFLYGSLYVREKGFWRKLGTLPKATHVFDVTYWKGKLYATGVMPGSLVCSADGGLSWQVVEKGLDDLDPGEMAIVGDTLYIFGSEGLATLHNGRLERHILDLCPGYTLPFTHRVTPFAGGVVYTTFHSWGRTKDTRHPLFFLPDLKTTAKVSAVFAEKTVRDIKAEGDTLYVLTAGTPQEGGKFPGEIYSTQDLKHWTRLAAFTLPATPSAFALLDGHWYVGTANRGYDAATYGSNSDVHTYAYADTASGSIWQIKP